MNKEQEIQKISITDSVVQALSQRIYSGQYKPGEKISTELQLCEELGVSRTCLREAFRVLQALGLVTIYRGRGAYVSENLPSDENTSWYDDTDAEFYDFIEVRMAIEPLSTQLAIERSTDEQIAELDTIHKSFLEAVDHKDMTKLIMLDELFHTTIVQMSGNKLLVNINKQLCQGNKKFRSESFLDGVVYKNAVIPHSKILECFHKRDFAQGETEMYNHLVITRTDMEYLQRKRNKESFK